jgi:hypothetical protein
LMYLICMKIILIDMQINYNLCQTAWRPFKYALA